MEQHRIFSYSISNIRIVIKNKHHCLKLLQPSKLPHEYDEKAHDGAEADAQACNPIWHVIHYTGCHHGDKKSQQRSLPLHTHPHCGAHVTLVTWPRPNWWIRSCFKASFAERLNIGVFRLIGMQAMIQDWPFMSDLAQFCWASSNNKWCHKSCACNVISKAHRLLNERVHHILGGYPICGNITNVTQVLGTVRVSLWHKEYY